MAVGFSRDMWYNYIADRSHPPVTSAVVEIPEYDPDHVYAWKPANNYKGWKLIARGEAGVDDADIIQQVHDLLPSHSLIKLIGTFTLTKTVKFTKEHIIFDARSARINVIGDIVGFDTENPHHSEFYINYLHGDNKKGVGFRLSGNVCKLDIRHCDYFDKGIYIRNITDSGLLDPDIFFGQIGACKYGIYIESTNIQGLRVFGNFINECSEACVYITGSGFNWNYFDVVALDAAGGRYNFYADASGYGNRCRISGFLAGATYNIYNPTGEWWFEVPQRWERVSHLLYERSIIEQVVFHGTKEITGFFDAKNLYYEPLLIINANNINKLNTVSCSVSDNGDGTFRLSSNATDWWITFPVNLPGSVIRYVVFKYKHVSGGYKVDGIYWKTPAHGYSATYRKGLYSIFPDGQWHVQWHDMWEFDDWKNSTITELRIDFTSNADTVLDLAFIGLFGQAPALSKNSGTATFSGDGSTTQFKIAHGLFKAPSKVLVTPMTADATGDFYVTADDTYIYINYKTAPASGTDNIKVSWYAEV